MPEKSEPGRYDRQMPVFGEEGQERLRNTNVFIAGAGGLGSPVSMYLAAAGIGRIRIVDHDTVDITNLNRQLLHGISDLGRQKTVSARETLTGMNPDVEIDAVAEKIDESNVFELAYDCDLIVDAMDNFHARYLLNKVAVARNIPLFHGAVHGFDGQVTTVIPGKTPCLRCIVPETLPGTTIPAIGATCGVIASVQVTEVLKYLAGIGTLATNRLLIWDGLNTVMNEISLERNPKCRDCGDESIE
ncbi:MAG: HesA/MoeB/ThiF family protein [Methanosarcinales archaeon]|nr:HesA/MoeB/ThiF family protein [Methanosarcinales archaeon]